MKRYAIRVNCYNTHKPNEFSSPSPRKYFSLIESPLTYVAESAKEAAEKAKRYVRGTGWCFFGKPAAISLNNVFFRVKERNSNAKARIFNWADVAKI